MVMKVLGYSANQASTDFSASIRSDHAFLPRLSSDEDDESEELECRKLNDFGRIV